MSNKRVYLVDDEPDFLELEREALDGDFNISCMSFGHAILNEIDYTQPSIVLLDVELPDINGYEVCKQIKEKDQHDNISIIFISGNDSINERLAGYSAGADDYIVKPVDIFELKAKAHIVSKFQQNKENIKTQETLARDMAFQAMSEASQYGRVLQFRKKKLMTVNRTKK